MAWFVKDSKILDFLYQIAKDPEMLEAYKQHPAAMMKAAGLSEEERAVLNSNDKEEIFKTLASEPTEI